MSNPNELTTENIEQKETEVEAEKTSTAMKATTIRLTEEEREILLKKAEKANISFSRLLVKSALDKNIKTLNINIGSQKVLDYISNIANNMNQIARRVNLNKATIKDEDFQKYLELIDKTIILQSQILRGLNKC
jgi:uncharacterized protein (DUF1778 family)